MGLLDSTGLSDRGGIKPILYEVINLDKIDITIVDFNLNELCDLLAALNQTDIAELTLKSEDFELTLKKGVSPTYAPVVMPPAVSDATIPIPPAPSPVAAASVAPAASVSVPTPPPVADSKWVEIISPMVGTFYRAPAPDEPPFVDVGDRISSGQTVCIIEAMKLMNELEAEVSGEIIEILVKNGEPVEYGQALMRVNPA
jgi:acetyl-CoA carboxylase biotin carboxyl carrier protein